MKINGREFIQMFGTSFGSKVGILVLSLTMVVGQASAKEVTARAVSPDGCNEIVLSVNPLAYEVRRNGRCIVSPSGIGLQVDGRDLVPAKQLGDRFHLVEGKRTGVVETPIYKKTSVDLSANETWIDFGDWGVRLVARDDGVAYRFETKFSGKITVTDEKASLELADPSAECLVYRNNNYGLEESVPEIFRFADVFTDEKSEGNQFSGRRFIYLPFVATVGDATVAVTESDVRDYPVWNLRREVGSSAPALEAAFERWPVSVCNSDGEVRGERTARRRAWPVKEHADHLVETDGTRTFPWRCFVLADSPSKLCESDCVYALACEQMPGDFSWVKPGKVAWDWWNAFDNIGDPQGCTTKTYERFIDFAAKHGVEYVILDEGWSEKLDIWKFHPNVDVPHLIRYADARGVGIILWMAWAQVDGEEERVAEHFGKLGAKGFKVDFMDRGDAAVERFLWAFADACARRQLVVDYHGAHRPTGLSRTYPNVLNYEGVHGLEQMKFYGGQDMMFNDVACFFGRLTAGPMDYTPGAMDNYVLGTYPIIKGYDPSSPLNTNPGSLGTRCHQMAMMVAYEAPLQMLADSPTKYEKNLESFAFMSKVPVVWAKTIGLGGSPKTYAAVARRAKDGAWYAAAINGKEARAFNLDTSFLGAGDWRAEVFCDVDKGDMKPREYQHLRRLVRVGDRLSYRLAKGGGLVIRFVPAEDLVRHDLVSGRWPWGVGTVKVDGKAEAWPHEGGSLAVMRTRTWDKKGFGFVERFVFSNATDHVLSVSELDVNVPLEDNYLGMSEDGGAKRCHAHVWPGGSGAWVCAMRMNGRAPHLGLVVMEGEVNGYELKERGISCGSSDVRGLICLSPPDRKLAPGETYVLSWKVFEHAGWDDFFRQVVEFGGVRVTADRWTVTQERPATVTFEWKGGCETRVVWYEREGEVRVPFRYADGKETFAELNAIADPMEHVLRRARFIVAHQQYLKLGDPYDGAFVQYDTETGRQHLNWLTPKSADWAPGAERFGIAVSLALLVQHGYSEFLAPLKRFARFAETLCRADGYVYADLDAKSRKRHFNSPWAAEFFLEFGKATGERKYYELGYRILRDAYSRLGQLMLVESRERESVEMLRSAGLTAEADELVKLFAAHKDELLKDGGGESREVNFAPEGAAGVILQFLDGFALTGRGEYRDHVLAYRPWFEANLGQQPSWHAHDIGLHHWDGFWFGKRECWGDTLPHHWNGTAVDAFRALAEQCGDKGAVTRAEPIPEQLLGLVRQDGTAGCAFVYPNRVNGRPARFLDPLANDQDWVLAYYLRWAFRNDRPKTTTYYVDDARGTDENTGTSPAAAWRSLDRVSGAALKPGDRVLFRRGGVWRGTLKPVSGEAGRPVRYGAYGEGPKPALQQSFDRSRPEEWTEEEKGIWITRLPETPSYDPTYILSHDIGNVIFNHGERYGVKKWNEEPLDRPLDFTWVRTNNIVRLRFDGNPGGAFDSIELAQNQPVVWQRRAHDVVYDGLWVRYTGNCGFGGGSTSRLAIRNCDISQIGGSHHRTYPDGWRSRFGNGVEFWGRASHNIVEGCRIWDVYDAALTHQNRGQAFVEEDIIYRDNVIWNCEYSFEYWNRPAESLTRHIVFAHNTCVNAGGAWSGVQRRSNNSAHLMFFWNEAKTEDFIVRDNVFVGSNVFLVRMDTDWCAELCSSHNLWWKKGDEDFILWKEKNRIPDFETYRFTLGLDRVGSVFGKPSFVDEAGYDYRLVPGSFGSNLASDGGPLGARR